MKKVLFPILAVVLALSLALPMAAVVGASPATMTVVSDDSGATVITTVYNKALGGNSVVDLSGSPLNAVRAWEPAPYASNYPIEPPEATASTWDNGVGWFETNASSADWIWETHRANGPASYAPADPLYDADAARYGRVVLFETAFNIPGNPISATLRIAADNAYEFWVNSSSSVRSSTAKVDDWENSDLYQDKVDTDHWQNYGTHTISVSELINGSNTLYVLAGNEYFWSDDGNTPTPPSTYNPGAAIFQLDVEYEEFVPAPGIQVVKSGTPSSTTENSVINYTYTVTNTGNVPLSSVAVSDNLVTPVTYQSGDDSDSILQTTETWIYTGSYQVPWFTAGPVVNTATAEGYWETTKVTDDDGFSVDILHNPDIEVTKSGPPETDPDQEGFGYFQTVDAEYTYTVTNTGDCALIVELEDSVYGILEPDDGDTYLLPSETWHYYVSDTLICEGYTMTIFTNTAIVVGEDALEAQVWDMACWNVVIFQWQPRTIGYWGNWANHYSGDAFEEIFDEVELNSPNLAGYTLLGDYNNVNAFLLGKPPKFKGEPVAKAEFLMEKQFLAAWLNVKSYRDWVDPGYMLSHYVGTADVGMDPNATVYLSGDAADLFGATPTVMDILTYIEDNKADWTEPDNFKTAQGVLDMMNNAESNDYLMFMNPDFEPSACPTP